MRRMKCYKCKEFELDGLMNRFHLKSNGHTRQIRICDDCLGKIVTSHFEGPKEEFPLGGIHAEGSDAIREMREKEEEQ